MKQKMKPPKPIMRIASCSFGKDSIATILLALEHHEPLDRVVYAEVMFDHGKGISGEIPEHIEWIYNSAIPRLEQMGVKVDVVRCEKDYVYYFRNKHSKGKWKDKICGFPIGGKCVINRDCKLAPIKMYYKQFRQNYNIVQYVGIAQDEPVRLARLMFNQVSLLDKYNQTEADAMRMCEKAGLLSPIYKISARGGCWFCPNAKIKQFAYIRKYHPQMWTELQELSKTPNLCSYGFKYGKTLQEIEKQIDVIEWVQDRQLLLDL